ncbi:MAG: helix-turn-helix domain-containing protein [Candidatus Eremiobacteraeota bacterium]|nr:helix-turn-helix domain-containing protein [Candidatus Eremiobacteraeota bacterium]MBV8355899.1 helix-turn-helix domain-containing protein [Candidatus Eremiobacteraeota bacterium]
MTAATVERRLAGPTSQTLDRGLRVLEVLADASEGMSIAELAQILGIDRAIVYRLVNTLSRHRLVARNRHGVYSLGTGVVTLARNVHATLQSAAYLAMTKLAEKAQMTAYLAMADGDEVVNVAIVEPREAEIHVSYRVGIRSPIGRGSAGIAILSGRPAQNGEQPAIARARELGYAVTSGELADGSVSLAAPIGAAGSDVYASIGVVTLGTTINEDRIAPLVVRAAATIAAQVER